MCLTIRGGLLLWMVFGDEYYYVSETIVIQRVMSHLAALGLFLEHVADIFLLITFVELASGFLLCLQGPGQPSSTRKVSRIAILVWSLVLFALAVALFGLQNSYAVRFISVSSQASRRTSMYQAVRTINQLAGALKILLWLTSILTLAAAAYVVHKTKNHEILRGVRPPPVPIPLTPKPGLALTPPQTAGLFLAATILDFIRLTVVMAINVHIYVANHIDVPQVVISVVEPFFNHVFMFVVLVLLFSLAIRKRQGLWSQPQSGWNYPSVAYMPTAQGQPVHMQMPMPYQGAGGVPTQQMHQPTPGLPAYLQVAQQQEWQKQQQQQQQQQPQAQQQQQQGQQVPPQGYYYYPQQTQQPMPAYQQGQQQGAEPIRSQ